MSDKCQDILRCDPDDLRQAMSIHTRKITDSCRDKDCIEDLPVYLTASSQALLNSSAGTRVRCAELISTYIDVEPVAFDRNHYCIDVTFYYRIIADTVVGSARPATLYGLAVFSKRAVLCGEDSCAHIYRSDTRLYGPDGMTRSYANRPSPGGGEAAGTGAAGDPAALLPQPDPAAGGKGDERQSGAGVADREKSPGENPGIHAIVPLYLLLRMK